MIGKVEGKNWRSSKGNTPIHAAVHHGHMEITRVIMENVANKNPANNKGKTPLYVAAKMGHYEICKLILENVTDIMRELHHFMWLQKMVMYV